MKPQYTEREILELNDLYFNTGYSFAIDEILQFLNERYYGTKNDL